MVQILGYLKNTSGWTACIYLSSDRKSFKLINLEIISPSKCSIKLSTHTRYARRFIFCNVPGVISGTLLPYIDSSANFLRPLNALKFIVSILQSLTEISSRSISRLEINLSFSKDVMLLLSNTSFRLFVEKIKGILFNDEK